MKILSAPGPVCQLFKSCIAILMLVALTFPTAWPRADDTLGDFEEEIRKQEREEAEESDYDDSTATEDIDLELAVLSLFGQLFSSLVEPTVEHLEGRKKGEPAAAVFRLENGYQPLSKTDVDGFTFRSELMWLFVGVGGEFIRYWEKTPRQELDFWTAEALLRLAPHRSLRLTLAGGSRSIHGDGSRTGFQGGFSLGVYPARWLGVEADLRWAAIADRTLGDYRGGALLRIPRFPYAAVRGGYRAIHYADETLDGAEVGLVITW